MEERIKKALRDSTERGQLNEAWAVQAILTAVTESLPKHAYQIPGFEAATLEEIAAYQHTIDFVLAQLGKE